MKTLWLLRHAKSAWDDPELPDRERPLAPRGVEAATAIARYLETTDPRPTLVLCSAARRTRETLALVLPALGPDLEVRIEPELYTFDADRLLARLRRVADRVPSVMLVGHNPATQELALSLASDGPRLPEVQIKFPTAAIATIELATGSWAEVRRGTGILTGFVLPRELV